MPRWIIFILDLLLCCLSTTVAYLAVFNFDFIKLRYVLFGQDLLISLAISAVVFFLIKTYAGIISYTSAQDSFRILFAIFISNTAFFLVNLCSEALGKGALVTAKMLLINGLLCFLLLITYRILAKYFFLYISKLKLDTKRVIIYGVDEAGVAAKKMFDHDYKVNKSIIAFVDDDPKKVGNTILGIKILNANKLPEIIAETKCDEVIIASRDISLNRKNWIVDTCLEHHVKILSIPSHDAWPSGKLQMAQIQNINIEELLDRDTIDIDIKSIQSELKDKVVLITGAAGSIGSEIVRQLLKFETGLIVMCDQSETALHELYTEIDDLDLKSNFHAFIGDIRDESRMDFLFETYMPNYVYHAAAYKHVPLMEFSASEAIKTNVLGTKIIADLSVKFGVEKFVMVSTDKAVNPTNVMGASKRIAEIYVQSLNKAIANGNTYFRHNHTNDGKPVTRFITTRFGNVLGSNGSVIPRFKKQIERGGPVTITHPDITRFFMTIPEASRLVLEAGCMGRGGEIYVFDMGEPVKIIDMAKRMIQLAGLNPDLDIKIEFTGLRPGEKLYEELLNDGENVIPTHHEKIMIGKVREYIFSDVESQIHSLINDASKNDNFSVVKAMKSIVNEFRSKNSEFEQLDFLSKAI